MRELSELGTFAACAVENSKEPFIAWLRDGRILAVNRPFQGLAGYSRNELEGMRWPEDFTAAETRDMIEKAMNGLANGKEMPGHDMVLLRKDRSRVNVTASVHRYCPDGSDGPYYFSFITDVTERNRERMALQEAQAQAELLLDLMSHDIDNMNRVSIRHLELALATARLRPGERELIMAALGSLVNSSRLIGNVRRVQYRDRPEFP